MKRWMWIFTALVVLPVLLLVLVALVLQRWVASEDFRGFVGDQITQAIGVPVDVGRVHVDVWPLPAIALEQVRITSKPPLTLERIEARPSYAPLLAGRLEVATLIVRNAVVPEQAVMAIAAALQRTDKSSGKVKEAVPAKGGPHMRVALPRRTVLDGLTWVGARGKTNTIDATATLDADDLPGKVDVRVRAGTYAGAKLMLERQVDHWAVRADIGGGTVKGTFRFDGSKLQGDLATSNVELAALTAPSRTLTGKIDATTNLRADLRGADSIADAISTQTKFNVRGAVVQGLDLAQAVKSVGMSRGGQTSLDTLAGNVATQGKAVNLTNLVATSGVLSATGNIAMAASKSLNGRITVDLASGAIGGAVGIPLAVGGTLDSPSVTLSRGALIGAAIGTAIAPGLGTGGGAKIGDKLGEGLKGLFGK
ncbi:AsmA family protein [Caenimonas sp. SL110]|uniref:AsmA family protein n=1 Tax=Caenimonas sp. SL110 TaxID=1450524 RepID=UPI000A584154|nr:AsmA family protein [Caenimonas sp. SL110]